MDNELKLLLSRPSFELEYQDRSIEDAYMYIDTLLYDIWAEGRITKSERSKLISINEEIYQEHLNR